MEIESPSSQHPDNFGTNTIDHQTSVPCSESNNQNIFGGMKPGFCSKPSTLNETISKQSDNSIHSSRENSASPQTLTSKLHFNVTRQFETSSSRQSSSPTINDGSSSRGSQNEEESEKVPISPNNMNIDNNNTKGADLCKQYLSTGSGVMNLGLRPKGGSSDTSNEHNLAVFESYLRYAEILYKCSLCTSMPAIFTSREHFLHHIKTIHLEARGHKCQHCVLQFDVLEDVQHHHQLTHLDSIPSPITHTANNSASETNTLPALSQITQKEYVSNSNEKLLDVSEAEGPNTDSSCKDDDATPCRSRRKRSFPRHVELEASERRCASTDSTGSCSSNESHRSERLDGVVPQTDYTLLSSDRKRLMPWSPRSKLAPGSSEEQGQRLQESTPQALRDNSYSNKSTICYKPPLSTDLNASDNNSNDPTNKLPSGKPLDLVLQEISSCTGIKQEICEETSKTPEMSVQDDPVSDSNHKKRKLEVPTDLKSSVPGCPYPITGDFPRRTMPAPHQSASTSPWNFPFYNVPRQQQPHQALLPQGVKSVNNSAKPPVPPIIAVKTEISAELEKTNLFCAQCKIDFVSAEQFCQHYKEMHLAKTPINPGQAVSAGDQQFRLLWLKQHLAKYLALANEGVVLRDDLLNLMMATGVDTSDAATWGPACNRAVREVYPDSQAHRKGKFKKTYFFGVMLVGASRSSSCPEFEDEVNSANHHEEGGSDDEENEMLEEERAEGKVNIKDLEKLTAHLPCVIRWTGHMDACITRCVLLETLAKRLDENEIMNWGIQCNRAVRQLYPEVSIKRKGKYKTTCYYGIDIINRAVGKSPQVSTWPRSVSGSGPPVVNVRDILEAPGHSSMSKLPRPGQQPLMQDSNQTNHLQAILNMLPTGGPQASGSPGMPRTNEGIFIARWGCDPRHRMPMRGIHSPVNHSRGTSPGSEHSPDMRAKLDSPQRSPLALTTHQMKNDNTTSIDLNSQRQFNSGMTPVPSPAPQPSQGDALEKLVLLHPGPFVTVSVFSRRFQRYSPGLEKILYAMEMLQNRGLGQVCTIQQCGSKVFFKSIPSPSLEGSLNMLGIRMVDYQVMFYERDQKLDVPLHERLKAFHPQPDLLAVHYRH